MFDFQRGNWKTEGNYSRREPLNYIVCTQGLQGESGTRDDGICWQKGCFCPFGLLILFFTVQLSTESFLLEENHQNFFPLPPVYLAGDAIASEISLEVDGDVTALPKLDNYRENPKMILTGQSLELENVSLSAGETININTRGQSPKNDGSNLFPRLK